MEREEAANAAAAHLRIPRCSCREGLLKHRLPSCTQGVSASVGLSLGQQPAFLAIPTDSCTALRSTFPLPWDTLTAPRRLSLELRSIKIGELPSVSTGGCLE